MGIQRRMGHVRQLVLVLQPMKSLTGSIGFSSKSKGSSVSRLQSTVVSLAAAVVAATCSLVLVNDTSVNAASTAAGGFTGVVPARLLDTRERGVAVCENQSLELVVAGVGGVPASGVGGVAVNVTAVAASASSYLTVYPSGAQRPTASNLNFVAGQTIPNLVIVKVGSGGRINIYNRFGCVDVVVDVVGWFAPGTSGTVGPPSPPPPPPPPPAT